MLYNNRIWKQDMDRLLGSFLDLSCLSNHTVLITGATGLICSSVVDLLIRYNDMYHGSIRVLAGGRKETEFWKRFRSYAGREDFVFFYYDAASGNNQLPDDADFIIHGASNAFPAAVMKQPVETIMGNVLGLAELLDYARNMRNSRTLYISSSEVYGQNNGNKPYGVDEYGYVDILNPRNAYPMGKRAAESLCIAYRQEYNLDMVIARPGHIYGPTASTKDTRVSSVWPYAVARGEDIVMKSDGTQIRSYCYCLDCASALLKILVDGKPGQAYNISNPDSVISVRQLAELLAEFGGVNLCLEEASSEEKTAFNPMQNSSLDASGLLALGWDGYFTAEEGLAHTVKVLREIAGNRVS